ncbi:DNA glycosylase superfamily protein [Prunus dulcis]|uniref:DNA glycosylase superfamily protein n=1 Tax=Prunus dulcis TaxID=3755 RepID=A0A5H2XF15_PRUDU|nr:DNA glycosylase superfamily protein [Prunus dulcis]
MDIYPKRNSDIRPSRSLHPQPARPHHQPVPTAAAAGSVLLESTRIWNWKASSTLWKFGPREICLKVPTPFFSPYLFRLSDLCCDFQQLLIGVVEYWGNMVGQMKLMIAEEQKFQGKALSLSHTKTAITTIKEKFTEQQLQMFEQSCFGHLLRIEDLKWTSPIVHGLLLRKADPKTVSQLNGIKFIVGNKVIQFTAQQFCIVTGLRFGNLPFIPIPTNENCSLKRKYFANDKIEKHVHIDMRYLKLAEDLEDFGKYPWGAVCYAKTNASLLRALCADYQRVKVPTKTAKTKKSGKKPTTTATGRPREYHLKGFAYALQIWAYEVFPALAALHLVVHEDNAYIPRLLHWRSNSSPRFYELMSQVFENREVDVQLLGHL